MVVDGIVGRNDDAGTGLPCCNSCRVFEQHCGEFRCIPLRRHAVSWMSVYGTLLSISYRAYQPMIGR
jgi:hypothetical protein